jgi:hypothetical protein
MRKLLKKICPNDIIPSTQLMPSQSVEHFKTTILKVGSNGEIVREIKRI